jgi:hypothetical protein
MTADLLTDLRTRPRPRRRRLRRGAAPALVLALVGGAAACAQESGDTVTQVDVEKEGDQSQFSATAAYLSTVAEQSAAEPYRIEMDFAIDAAGEHLDVDNMMTGEIDGEQASMHVDMSSFFDQIPGGSLGVDADQMTMDMVTDGSVLYVKAPMFGALAEMAGRGGGAGAGEDLGPLADLAVVADQWGSIDPSALGDDASIGDVVGQAGAQGADPRQFLDLVSEATDPHELGDDVIKSERVQGLGATVTFGEMLAAQGRDVDEFVEQTTGGEALPQAMVDQLLQTEVPVEVWVDGDDHVRRVSLDLDLGALLSSAGVDDAEMEFSYTLTMDFFDYRADDIAIEVPEAAVDVTDAYGALLAAG